MSSLLSSPRQHWFFRYKLYHIPFWYLYNYLWWAIAIRSFGGALYSFVATPYFIKASFYALPQAGAVCFTLYVLIPRLLEKDKLLAFAGAVVATIFATCLVIVPGYFVTAWVFHKDMNELFGQGPFDYWEMVVGTPLSSTTAAVTFGMSIKLARSWLQSRRHQRLLEKEKLETELKFLKSQFNPHFLFNSINAIFFLIHKNPDKASAALAKFSDLLRYQLYECNDAQIALQNELRYLENFMDLEKLRLNNNVEVYLELKAPADGALQIAPFILMAFVENAFKHVSKHTEAGRRNWIRIALKVEDNLLTFYVGNSKGDGLTTEVLHTGGIGLQNVKRRLDLLYQQQYQLRLQQDDTQFEVHLQLQLQSAPVKETMQFTLNPTV